MDWTEARSRKEGGQMLVLFVLALGVLMGLTAMVIDVGLILHERRSLQNAADAAALAGVQELPVSPGMAVSKALEWADNNGYGADTGAKVTVNTPYQGDPEEVEVIIENEMPFIFGRVLGLTSTGVQARAVASNSTAKALGVALLVLNPQGGASFDKTGNGDLIIDGGGAAMVNDGSPEGTRRGGSGDVITTGGFYYYSQGSWVTTGGGQFDPDPESVSFRLPDPLAGLTPPDPYAIGTSLDSGGPSNNPRTRTLQAGNHVLHPGTYWGGIEITSTANVTFEPGIYVIAGGGFKLTGTGTIVGNGVFFYNTSDPENLDPNADGVCEEINLRGGANFTLTAPTAGLYKDILFWQDVNCDVPMKHSGNGDFLSGVIYLPGTRLDLSGGGNVGTVQIITDTIDISGNSDLIIDFREFVDIPVPDDYRLIE